MSSIAWPWLRGRADAGGDVAVLGGTPDALCWLHGEVASGRARALRGGGMLERGSESAAEFARHLRALGLPRKGTLALLPLETSQLLQIETPNVARDELKAAARWHVKDLVQHRLDELTLDVMPVGDGRGAAQRHLFVAAARSDVIRQRVELAAAAGIELAVVDVVEAAQRNLQCALAAAAGLEARATAALVRHGSTGLLTICAGGELYYSRRLEGLDEATPTPSLEAAPAGAGIDAFELPAIVDYSVETMAEQAVEAESPRLVIEIQRSVDVWERTWRDLPLARLWVDWGDDSATWQRRLAPALGVAVHEMRVAEVLPGFDAVARTPALRDALLPLAGALLRHETRSL